MSIRYEDSYVGQLRNVVGHAPLIVPSVRAIISNAEGQVLFLKHNERWTMPAGSIELGESIYDTLKREVLEETGLEVVQATLIAIYTGKSVVANSFSDEYQLFEFLFTVDQWVGDLVKQTDETTDAKFFEIKERPVARDGFWGAHYTEVFEDYKQYGGTVILK
ncbi:NUDIX domain-containing protein [Brevibacillus sp. 179-C9.3 HS]|uniref:NUDIX domain-containing protein n=1 Tax=unclassified Brevibacillus TaxID=2684853 RepID=UPI0039A387C0